jgi:hypothetical protein
MQMQWAQGGNQKLVIDASDKAKKWRIRFRSVSTIYLRKLTWNKSSGMLRSPTITA